MAGTGSGIDRSPFGGERGGQAGPLRHVLKREPSDEALARIKVGRKEISGKKGKGKASLPY